MKPVRVKGLLFVAVVSVAAAGTLLNANIAQATSLQAPAKPKPSASAKPKPPKPAKPANPKPRKCATGGTCVVGDIGPGGGLVFLISVGLRYEMAPNTWGVNETTGIQWCSDQSNSVATGIAVGTGSANTTAMLTSASPFVACTAGAPIAVRAYRGGGFSDWFLPSKDELNAMCNYSRNPSAPAAPSVSCYGRAGAPQNATFASSAYGFVGALPSASYWSSSQFYTYTAWKQVFHFGTQSVVNTNFTLRVRPVRAF